MEHIAIKGTFRFTFLKFRVMILLSEFFDEYVEAGHF